MEDLASVLPESIQPYFPLAVALVKAIAIFVVGWIISKWAYGLMLKVIERRNLDRALGGFLAAIAQYTVLGATVIASLGAVGVETTSLVAVLGSAGIAVGLALQGNLSNFASGVMILFFKPFILEDKITAAGITGQVKDIGLFATTLYTDDFQKIIVGNAAITGGTIVNLTGLGIRRVDVDAGVAYGTDATQVMEILRKAAARADGVIDDPGASVAFVGLGASSIDFSVRGWCQAVDYLDVLHNIRLAIYEDLNAAGIDIPFNQIVVHQA